MSDEHMDFNLPWEVHFAFKCTCGEACVISPPLSKELAESEDPLPVFNSFPEGDRQALVAFWGQHEALGHTVEPTLLEIAPMPKA